MGAPHSPLLYRLAVKLIGLIHVQDPAAFSVYREQVTATVERYNGKMVGRGRLTTMLWNELDCPPFEFLVELAFPSAQDAQQWADSPEYTALLSVRSQAMRLTLFGVE